MVIAVLQNVGTVLRHANAALQEIDPDDDEVDSIKEVKEKGSALVAALDQLGVGSAPVPEGVKVVPSVDFMAMSESVMLSALGRLQPVTKDELPVQFSNIEELKNRISELSASIAAAVNR